LNMIYLSQSGIRPNRPTLELTYTQNAVSEFVISASARLFT
jgi:hypothetical protein